MTCELASLVFASLSDGNINNVTAGVISTADDAPSMQFGIRLAW